MILATIGAKKTVIVTKLNPITIVIVSNRIAFDLPVIERFFTKLSTLLL